MQELAVQVRDLTKQYTIGLPEERASSLPEVLMRYVVAPFRRNGADRDSDRERSQLWALRDVSFEVPRGQVVGVIGRNGAGKSTLLKILSRITGPTSGEIELHGRVASLLEVGTGFHPELNGRENIYLNGAMLGMARHEIERRFDEIVDFSGVARFLDTPVKRYSSGMYTRLAFAVAAHLDPEILIVDEVLAVGDAEFQKKCIGKMGEVTKSGRTVIFVSHNMGAVQALCQRVIWLHEGRLVAAGTPAGVIPDYLSFGANSQGAEITWAEELAPRCRELSLHRVRLLDEGALPRNGFRTDDEVTVEMEYEVKEPIWGMRLSVRFVTELGDVAFYSCSHLLTEGRQAPGRYVALCKVPRRLLNRRRYVVRVGADVPGQRILWDDVECLTLTVDGVSYHGSRFEDIVPGAVCPELKWQVMAGV